MDLAASSTPITDYPPLQLALGTTRFDPGVPVLAGQAVVEFFAGAEPAGRSGAFSLFRQGPWLLGVARCPIDAAGVEATTAQLYRDLFPATQGQSLARIWNYVPAINAPGASGLENYREFCRARSLAFAHHHGRTFKAVLPAASAVGTDGEVLTVAFAASREVPRHFENPRQIAAYEYPLEYGPYSPSFSRATVTPHAVFVSGTAAIRGHATVAPDRIDDQLDCTLENLREISLACGLPPELDRHGKGARHFKVYLRHASDLGSVSDALQRKLLTPRDRVTYLRADICRASLLVEIEATLFPH